MAFRICLELVKQVRKPKRLIIIETPPVTKVNNKSILKGAGLSDEELKNLHLYLFWGI